MDGRWTGNQLNRTRDKGAKRKKYDVYTIVGAHATGSIIRLLREQNWKRTEEFDSERNNKLGGNIEKLIKYTERKINLIDEEQKVTRHAITKLLSMF